MNLSILANDFFGWAYVFGVIIVGYLIFVVVHDLIEKKKPRHLPPQHR
jgi:hypothetical protein